jgi:hypothetical protein
MLSEVLAGGQDPEPGAQALLGFPRPGGDRWGQALLAAGDPHPDGGAVLVGPGRLDQLGAQVGVAGLGERAAVDAGAAGVLAWDQPAKPHELARGGEPAPVSDLGGQRQRAQPGDASVGGQPGDLPVERRAVAPAGKVGLHRVQVRVADLDHGQVVPERLGHGGLLEPLRPKPRLVLERPG